MDLLYRKAGIRDLDMLTETRIQVLRAANHLDETVDMSKVRQESYDYYAQALRDGTHTAYLVFDGDRFACCCVSREKCPSGALLKGDVMYLCLFRLSLRF